MREKKARMNYKKILSFLVHLEFPRILYSFSSSPPPINPFYSSSSFFPILILREKVPEDEDEEDEGEEDEEDPVGISQHFSSASSFPHHSLWE